MPKRTRSYRPSLAAVLYGLAVLSCVAAVGFAMVASATVEAPAGPAVATAICTSVFLLASVRLVA